VLLSHCGQPIASDHVWHARVRTWTRRIWFRGSDLAWIALFWVLKWLNRSQQFHSRRHLRLIYYFWLIIISFNYFVFVFFVIFNSTINLTSVDFHIHCFLILANFGLALCFWNSAVFVFSSLYVTENPYWWLIFVNVENYNVDYEIR